MGFSERHQKEGGKESKTMKWAIAGISIRAQLKAISTAIYKESEEGIIPPTTPTGRETKIPEKLRCPPAPRKRRPSGCINRNCVEEVFVTPDFDLESVFVRRA